MCQIDLPMKKVPKPTTAYLDDSEPLLKIPIWRGCAATRKSAKDSWMPAIMGDIESDADKEKTVRSAEEDEALTQEGCPMGQSRCSCC